MSRLRVTVRGDGTELRGYATIEALVSLTSEPGQQPYVVMASPAEDDWSPFTEPEYPPTLEKSLEIVKGIMDDAESVEAAETRLAHLHTMQAQVIRAERRESLERELHHFETEQKNAQLNEAINSIAALAAQTDVETTEATQAWLVNNIRAVISKLS